MRPSSLLVLAVAASFAAGLVIKSLAPGETIRARRAHLHAALHTITTHGVEMALPDNTKAFPEGLQALP
jgi:hypothetical protein